MADVTVRGAEQFVTLAKNFKAAGPEFRKATLRNIRAAGEPVKQDVRAGILATFPNRGGMANRAARTNIGIRTRATGKQAGIRLVATGGKRSLTNRTLASIDASGTWRHPVYGTRKWVGQSDGMATGWWSEEIPRHKPEVQEKILAAMDEAAKQITRGV